MTILVEQQKNCSAQLVITALNEAPGIGLTIAEMIDAIGEVPVIVVDGRSTDRTVEIAKNMGAKVLLQDGKGKGNALKKALEHIDPTIEFVIVTDADYTYPAQQVPEMIKMLEENPLIGMVCGNRLTKNVDKDALYSVFHIGNELLALAHKILNGVQLQDPLTGLRVIRTSAVTGWLIKSAGFDIEVELNQYIERQGYQTREVPIGYRVRLGEKKLKPIHGFEILKRMILEAAY